MYSATNTVFGRFRSACGSSWRQAFDVAGLLAHDAWESELAFQTPQVRHVYAFTHRQLPDAFVGIGPMLLQPPTSLFLTADLLLFRQPRLVLT